MRSERSLILTTAVGGLFHTAVLLSLFLLFAGHNAPGGGFVGGLVAGAALVLRYVDAGAEAVRRTVPIPPFVLLGVGLAIAIVTGAAAWIGGGAFLESATWSATVPLIGDVKTTSALPFDIAVYVVVVGLVLFLLEFLGSEPA
jgi:multicomponent Na+:H+ antiporter subunit A